MLLGATLGFSTIRSILPWDSSITPNRVGSSTATVDMIVPWCWSMGLDDIHDVLLGQNDIAVDADEVLVHDLLGHAYGVRRAQPFLLLEIGYI